MGPRDLLPSFSFLVCQRHLSGGGQGLRHAPGLRSPVYRVSLQISALLSTVVRHPTAEELPRPGVRFARLAGSAALSRVVGAIDACHVRVKPPAEDAACYFNRKLFHSIQLQSICDDHCKFIDLFVACLSQPICIMTPFRQPVRNHIQARYNCCLSKASCVVDRFF